MPRRSARTTTGVLVLSVAAATLSLVGPAAAAPGAAEAPAQQREKTNRGAIEPGRSYDRFLVHFAEGSAAQADDTAARAEVEQVARTAGRGLQVTRRMSTGGVVVQVNARLDAQQAQDLVARFVERAAVGYAEADVQMTATLTPNDGSYLKQWHYYEAVAGMNLPTAWDSATGAGVTVAVLDTGITGHSDLNANVAGGYDFVSSSTAARDGNGRDANPADEGDWYSAGECGQLVGSNSSWHGTHVAGTVAAATNNGTGVSGVAFGAKVQPVRVLGKCGGSLSDIADAITWASGGAVTGIPANPSPAKVINMSLGGSGTCGSTYQNAINAAVARGTAVIVAAGNSNADAGSFQPSSCASTVVVAASDREGNRAAYSNYGTKVDLAAPGGETGTAANGVLSTLNAGTTTPAAESYAYYQGTSMATPHVAGLAALVLGKAAMSPADLEATLKSGTRPLAGTCSGGCGTGLADAAKTVAAVGTTSPTPTEPTEPVVQESLFTNGTDYAILDRKTIESPISVSRTGNAPSALQVPVTIRHAARGDLQIDLVAPDGSLYRLRSSSTDQTDDVIQTFTVNASGEPASGTWKLRVQDRVKGSTGTLDTWSLQF